MRNTISAVALIPMAFVLTITPSTTDEQILEAFAETDDREYFDELHRRYYGQLLAMVRGKFPLDLGLAEDAVQKTFLALLEDHRGFDRKLKLGPWLRSVAIHRAIDLKRISENHFAHSFHDVPANGRKTGNKKHSTTLEPADKKSLYPPQIAENNEMVRQLRAAITTLTERDKAVVEAIHIDGLTAEATAIKLNIPIGSISTHLSRAMNLLRIRMSRPQPAA